MKLLKASVIIMGVLIVLGIVALITAVAMRGSKLLSTPDPIALDTTKTVIQRLNLPEGSEVRQMLSRDKALVLHIRIPDRGDWIYFVPLAKDGKLSAIAVSERASPPAPAKDRQ